MTKIIKPTVEHVIPSKEYFKISGVNYKGNIHTYRLYDKMTSSMNQDKLAKFSREQKEEGNPYAIGIPQFLAICEAGVKSGNAGLMNSLHKELRKYPNFLSRVIDNPSPLKDKTIHEYGMPDEYSLEGDIVGEDGWIKDIDNKKSLELLTEIKNINKLNKISQRINQTPMYLWRVNSKPSEKIESVVGFGANNDRLSLLAYGSLSNEYPAFRVLQVD